MILLLMGMMVRLWCKMQDGVLQEWRLGYNDMHGYETETHIGIHRSKSMMPFIGFDWRYRKFGINEIEKTFGQSNTKDNRSVVV
jgi:hypothetical protein